MNLFERGVQELGVLVRKARTNLTGASRGTLGGWAMGVPHTMGQANVGSGVTFDRMREIVLKTPTAGAALNAMLDYAVDVGIHPRNVDHSQRTPVRAEKFLNNLLGSPNPTDTERQFRYKLLRDMATLGFAAIEIERSASGAVANLFALDAARLRVDYDEHGSIQGYDMQDRAGKWIVGRDGVHAWPAADVIWLRRDTISSSQFPTSRIEQLYACAILESLMMAFIGGRFTDSNVPFGLMDLGDISENELHDAITLWNQQTTDREHPEHRIVFTGSKGGANWIPFGYALKDLEAPELLSRVRLQILAILGVTVNELGEADDVNKSNGYNLTFTFKKRAIEPLLNEYTQTLTRRLVWDELSFLDTELWFDDIDSRDELLQSQIDDMKLKMGIMSINTVRNRDGLASTPGGDEPMVYMGASVIPVAMLRDFAQVQLEALQMLNMQTQVGITQVLQAMAAPTVDANGNTIPAAPIPQLAPLASAPLMRGVQPPEKFVTMDGSGSSTTKFHEPKPAMKPPAPGGKKPASGKPQAARGPVQANRNAGLRKEDTQ